MYVLNTPETNAAGLLGIKGQLGLYNVSGKPSYLVGSRSLSTIDFYHVSTK